MPRQQAIATVFRESPGKNMKKFLIAMMFFSLLGKTCFAQNDSISNENSPDSLNVILSAPINPALLEKYNEEVRENPQKFKRRWQRTLILLQHGDTAPTMAGDIEYLLTHPLWRGQGMRLKAMYRYLQGHLDEAKALMRQNILEGTNIVEQAGFLAKIALSTHDTAAAIAAYRLGWDQHPDENIYVELLHAYRGSWKPPQELLDQGRRVYPGSPGILQTLFDAYGQVGTPACLRERLALAAQAEKTLWPASVDWKIKYAEALLSLEQRKEAETVLIAAVDLLDNDPRLEGENGEFRKKIFSLLEVARK